MRLTRVSRAIAIQAVLVGLLWAAPAAAQDERSIERVPVEIAQFDVTSVVPADWSGGAGGIFTRGTPPDDLALMAIQAAPATIDQLWSQLLPQLGLPESPEPTGELHTNGFEWTLYRFDVAPGGVSVAVELALAEGDGRTSIVLFQAAPEEFEVLRAGVFAPAVEAFAPLAPEVTPHPSTFDYQIEEVAFPGGADGVELAGTLTLPPGDGPHPTIVLMSGSGAQDRDESLKPLTTLKPFAEIADALTSAGVGVLRYDDRGVGGSTGDYDGSTVSELASDGGAAIDYLATRADIDASRIGVLGHSEGGLYASMLGATDPRISFIVVMAPGVVDGVELLLGQNEAILRANGESEDEIAQAIEFSAAVLPLVRDDDLEAASEVTRAYLGALWDGQSAEDQAVLGERASFIARTLAVQEAGWQPAWLRTILAYDPRLDWQQVRVPVLGLFGARDVQVVLEQNEPALREALAAAGNEDFETVVFPEANHLFQDAISGAVSEYPSLEPAFTEAFLPTLVDWVTARTDVDE